MSLQWGFPDGKYLGNQWELGDEHGVFLGWSTSELDSRENENKCPMQAIPFADWLIYFK